MSRPSYRSSRMLDAFHRTAGCVSIAIALNRTLSVRLESRNLEHVRISGGLPRMSSSCKSSRTRKALFSSHSASTNDMYFTTSIKRVHESHEDVHEARVQYVKGKSLRGGSVVP